MIGCISPSWLAVMVPSHRTPDLMLDEWRRTNRKAADIETVLAVDWPEAGLMMRQLASFLTDSVLDGDGKPLLFACLSEAMTNYEIVRLKGATDPQRLIVFASSLFTRAIEILDYQVTVRQQRWHPEDGEPLLDWVVRRGNVMSVVGGIGGKNRPSWKTVATWVISQHLYELLEQAEEIAWPNR